jgi:hypothetical protein
MFAMLSCQLLKWRRYGQARANFYLKKPWRYSQKYKWSVVLAAALDVMSCWYYLYCRKCRTNNTLRKKRLSSFLKNLWVVERAHIWNPSPGGSGLFQAWTTSAEPPKGCKYVPAQNPLGFLKSWKTLFSKSVVYWVSNDTDNFHFKLLQN